MYTGAAMTDKLMERIGLDAGHTCRLLREFAALAIDMGLPDKAREMHALADRWATVAIDTIEDAAAEETNPFGLALDE